MAYGSERHTGGEVFTQSRDDEIRQSLVGGWWHGVSPDDNSDGFARSTDGSHSFISARRLDPALIPGIAFAVDIVACLAGILFALAIEGGVVAANLLSVGASHLILLMALRVSGLYDAVRMMSVRRQVFRVLVALTPFILVNTSIALFLSSGAQRFLMVETSFLIITLVSLRVSLAIAGSVLVAQGRLCSAVAVVGERPHVGRVRRMLRRVYSGGLTRCRSYCISPDVVEEWRPTLKRLVDDVRAGYVDEILLVSDHNSEQRIIELGNVLRNLPVDLYLYPVSSNGLKKLVRRGRKPWQSATVALSDRPIRGWGVVLKSSFDRLASLCILIVLSPVLLVIAIGVKLTSDGPVFFIQSRFGYNCRPFPIIKFRTMHSDKCDLHASELTMRDDPRVTKIGKFLRATSLDEIPQIINVLRGEMSLVGPRPHVTQAKAGGRLYDMLIPTFHSRYRVKPGLTGLAQVRGQRGNTETETSLTARFHSDMAYINNWSFFLDVKILVLTGVALIKPQNAF